MLARGVGTVVAAEAIACDIHMIEVGREPGDSRMAIVAIVATCNVRGVLARREVPIVAGGTLPQHLGVVDRIGWRPDNVVVAVLANIGC